MAKIVKRKVQKRKMRIEGVAFLLLAIALCSVLFSSLFIRTQKNHLTMQIEDINAECATLTEANDQLNVEIQNLISKDRVYEIASNNGLTQDDTTVINVSEGDR